MKKDTFIIIVVDINITLIPMYSDHKERRVRKKQQCNVG
jgi:hypothetical protein